MGDIALACCRAAYPVVASPETRAFPCFRFVSPGVGGVWTRQRRDKRYKMNEIATLETVVVGETDLLYGVAQIACYLGLAEGRARYLCESGSVPTFKMGRIICSRKSAIEASLDERLPVMRAPGDRVAETSIPAE